MIRHPAVAGQFYPSQSAELLSVIKKVIPERAEVKKTAIGVVSPHAGYIYSGAVAGALLSSVEIPAHVLILGPNHHGLGARIALYPEGEWLSPLGSVQIDARLTQLLKDSVPGAEFDTLAHQHEHSLEVQVPFLQVLRPDVSIAAMSLGFGDYVTARRVGEGVASVLQDFSEDVLIVASSDMSHFETDETARVLDNLAIKKILELDPEGLHTLCRERRITMCGMVPAAVMLVAAKSLGCRAAELKGYATSGDVNGDRRRVVGYAGITVC